MENENSIGIKISKKTVMGVTAILIGIMILGGILTQIIPSGAYDLDETGAIINGTYHEIAKSDVGYSFWRVFISPVEAFIFDTSSAMTGVIIILVITLIGGTFLILSKSGVMKYMMCLLVNKFEKKKYFLLAALILACMLLSSFAGVLEESITLVPFAIAIALSFGWDSFVGLGMSLLSVAFGYSAATFNPFNVGVVQSMTDLPMFSGVGYRIVVFIVIYSILTAFFLLYAKRIEKNPQKSLCYETDAELRERYAVENDSSALLGNKALSKGAGAFGKALLTVLIITIICLVANIFIDNATISDIIGYMPLVSMTILFTVGGIRAGILSGMSKKDLKSTFSEGIKTVLPVVPMIILIICVTYILKQGMIIDTMLYYVYDLIKDQNAYVSVIFIFFVICVFEFFIGSGTAKAFLLMPILLPLVNMVGIGEQNLILSFCISDGFCNVLFPTNGLLMISLGMLGISYGKYIKITWKLFAAEFAAAIALMLFAQYIGY